MAAIVTAIFAAFVKKPEEPRARASYDVLARKVEELQQSQRQQHDDTVALRAYLSGYLEALRKGQKTLAERPVPITIRPPARPVATAALPPPPKLPEPKSDVQALEAPPDFAALDDK